VGEGLPAIPAGGAESTRGVVEAIEDHGEGFVGGGDEVLLVHLVRLGVVEGLVATDAGAETVDAFEVGFHVRFPLTLGPTIATVLETDRGIYRECRGAIRIRRIDVVL